MVYVLIRYIIRGKPIMTVISCKVQLNQRLSYYSRLMTHYESHITFLTYNKKPAMMRAVCQVRSFDVINARVIRKHRKRRCIRRTFGECLPVGLRLRMYLAQCHNANLRRIVRTIYKSLVQLPFERIGLWLFRACGIGCESWRRFLNVGNGAG